MISAPPGLPALAASRPSASKTRVGAIDERGRLPGSTRLATGRPVASAGAKLKSLSSLFSRKPRTIWRAPKASSMVVVIDTARPSASTMLMWLVPYSICSAIGAKLVRTGPGTPAGAVGARCAWMSLARASR